MALFEKVDTFKEAKKLYNEHREYITYESLKSMGYVSFEVNEILKYLALLRASGVYAKYLVTVLDNGKEVYECYIYETNIERARSVVETRCEMYGINYTYITFKKLNEYK